MRRAAILLVVVTTCGGSERGPASVEVTGNLLVTALGAQTQLAATVRDAQGNALAAQVAWSSSDATVASVDANGLVTAAANGTARIFADVGTVRGSAAVTVAQAPDSVAVVPPSATVERGATQAYSASVVDARGNAVHAQVTWSTSAPELATIDASGVATALSTGDVTITAAAGAKTGSATLHIGVPAAASAAIAGGAPLSSLGDTLQLTATARDARGATIPEATFEWATNDATVATVSTTGLVTAVANGTATITAASGTAQATLDVHVAQQLASVAVTPGDVTLPPDGTQAFSAQGLDARAHPIAGLPAATWASDDTSVVTIDTAGLARVVPTVNATTAAHVKATISSVQSAAATVHVDPSAAPVAAVVIGGGGVTLTSLGDTAQLSAQALNSASNAIPGAAFSWQSSDATHVSVDASGLVTATGAGPAVITASAGGKSDTTTITVQQAVASVAIGPPVTTTLTSLGDTVQLAASALDARGHAVADAAVSWSVDKPSIATVSTAGLVTAVANGAAVITASASGHTDTVTITVQQVTEAVLVSPSSTTVPPNTALDYAASAVDARGHPVATAAAPVWSSDSAVVSIDAAGHAVAGATSTLVVATITAAIDEVPGTATLNVDPAAVPVASVTVSGGGTLTYFDQTLQLTAQALDAAGQPLSRPIAWSSGNLDVATVDANGLVKAVGNGTAVITASAGGQSNTASVTVQQVVESVTVSGTSSLAAIAATATLSATAFDHAAHAVSGQTFTWRSDDASVSVDASGVITAAANGLAHVFAKTAGVESAGFAVTVQQAVASVVVSTGASTTLTALDDVLALGAAAFDANGHAMSATFTWRVSGAAVVLPDASVGSVKAVANGSAQVFARAGTVESAGFGVTVSQVVTSVALAPGGPLALASLGASVQLTATPLDHNAHAVASAVTFTSDSGAASVDSTGLVTAQANGVAHVTASSGAQTSAAVEIDVQQVLASIAVGGTSSFVSLQATATLSATGRDARGNAMSGVSVAWASDTPAVASVDTGGVVTAVANGTATISATSGAVAGTLLVTVQQAVATISVSGSPTTLTALDDTVQLTATAKDAGGSPMSATFSWSVVTGSSISVSTSGVATATANGTSTVQATSGGHAGSIDLTVAQTVDHVTPASASIPIGTTQQFTAVDRHGHPAPATWSSGDTTVATIDTAGLASAVGPGGPVTISAGAGTGAQLTVTCPTSFVVTAPGFFYSFNGAGSNPQVTVCKGTTVTFQLSNVTSIHPFCIWNASDQLDAPGVSNNCKSGNAVVTWAIPPTLSTGARYICDIHFFGNSFVLR